MAHENISIIRPQHYEACRTCPLMDKVVQKVEKEVSKVIKEDPNITGANVTITCVDKNYTNAKVSPNINTSFIVKEGIEQRFSRNRTIICPEISASRKMASKVS